MQEASGKKIFSGIAIGRIKFYTKTDSKVTRIKVDDIKAELAKYEKAQKAAIEQLNGLYEKALAEVGEANAEIFNVHAMMIEDEEYTDSVHNIITTQSVNAEYAIAMTGDNFAEMFANMEDEYFKARSADVKDITSRLLAILSGEELSSDIGDEPVIIVAEDLTPSETVQRDKSKILALVTRLGSSNSHTAILARTMGIPALIDVEISEDWNDRMGIVDGYAGKIIIDPDAAVLEEYYKKKEKAARGTE